MAARPSTLDKITVTLHHQTCGTLRFMVSRNVCLRKIMRTAVDLWKVDARDTRFLVDGKRLSPKQTLSEVDVQDGDTIDAMEFQVAGGCDSTPCTRRS